jgi:hypothetical protein
MSTVELTPEFVGMMGLAVTIIGGYIRIEQRITALEVKINLLMQMENSRDQK